MAATRPSIRRSRSDRITTGLPPDKPWPPGEYGWDGVAGTFFFIDPKDDLFVLCMMHTPSHRGQIETELTPLIFDAMVR